MKRLFFAIIALVLCGPFVPALDAQTTISPDEVFTITQDDIDQEARQVNSAITGLWQYRGPSVEVRGKNLIAGAGKAIARGKVKKKLNKAFKKIGLHKARPQFSLLDDGSCHINILGHSLNGSYTYDPNNEHITFRWLGIPVGANLKADGKNKLHLTFDADKLLWVLRIAAGVSDNSALKAIKLLTDNYQDVMMGFELRRQ